MTLFVAHYHFRPGGVRRVVELALPALARQLAPGLDAIVLVGGEAPSGGWLAELHSSLPPGSPAPEVRVHPSLGYAAEGSVMRATPATVVRGFLDELLAAATPGDSLVWLHNPGLGRNLSAIREWTRACARRHIPLVLHHHDWWFDNRWQRWPGMRANGGDSLARIARTLLPRSAHVRHVAINRADASCLRRTMDGPTAWIPNPATPPTPPDQSRAAAARAWLQRRTGHAHPVWLLPCRLLRRKNIAEALLLVRWLAPEARLATTAGVSSAGEAPYAEALRTAVLRHRWPLDLSILDGAPSGAPSVHDLLTVSDGAMLTSLVEGFGLPYLEAAAAARPLVARRLPNVAPDLALLGFRFPNLYREVRVDPGLFDAAAEFRRQEERFAAWLAGLPRGVRRLVPTPSFLSNPSRPVAFSRLTLTAQIEILALDPGSSLRQARRDNPWLDRWLTAGDVPRLQVPAWPARATQRLSTGHYARTLLRLARRPRTTRKEPGAHPDSRHAQEALMRARLVPEQLFPLLWTPLP